MLASNSLAVLRSLVAGASCGFRQSSVFRQRQLALPYQPPYPNPGRSNFAVARQIGRGMPQIHPLRAICFLQKSPGTACILPTIVAAMIR